MLRQLPEMEEPDYESIKYYNEDFSHKTVKWSIDMVKYREHLSSLKSYPCSGEGWEDRKEYEEEEFEIKVVEVYSSGGSSRYNDYKLSNGEIITCHRDAPPKVAVLKQKEDFDVLQWLKDTGRDPMYVSIETHRLLTDMYEYLKQHCTLTPKPITKN